MWETTQANDLNIQNINYLLSLVSVCIYFGNEKIRQDCFTHKHTTNGVKFEQNKKNDKYWKS